METWRNRVTICKLFLFIPNRRVYFQFRKKSVVFTSDRRTTARTEEKKKKKEKMHTRTLFSQSCERVWIFTPRKNSPRPQEVEAIIDQSPLLSPKKEKGKEKFLLPRERRRRRRDQFSRSRSLLSLGIIVVKTNLGEERKLISLTSKGVSSTYFF